MNIVAFLHAARDPASFIVNRKAQKIFVNRESYTINPSDKNALEAALRLVGEGATVTAVAAGNAPAEDALRQARAMGAHRAVLVRDPALEQADASALTRVLQGVVNYLGGINLVVLGAEAFASELAQVGPRLAAALDWPFIESVQAVSAEGPSIRAVTQQADGFHQFEAGLPAVVSVARDSNKPRYASGTNIINIYKAKDAVEAFTTADLQLTEADLTPLTELRGESFPPEREFGKRLDGALDEIARQVADAIRKI